MTLISLRLAHAQHDNAPIMDEIAKRLRPTVKCPECSVEVPITGLSNPNRCHAKCPLYQKPKQESESC